MGKPIVITRKKAIEVMEENLRVLKESSDSDTFLLLSCDLQEQRNLGKRRLNKKDGEKLINESKTFILDEDEEEDSVSILSIYSERQNIYNILPIGKKHDMILIPQLE